jgi:hypothetical protein
MHENSILLFKKYALPLLGHGMKVLEIGPDTFPSSYRKLVTAAAMAWETLDIYDSPQLTYPKSDVYRFGGRVEKSFDNITTPRKPAVSEKP